MAGPEVWQRKEETYALHFRLLSRLDVASSAERLYTCRYIRQAKPKTVGDNSAVDINRVIA